jgi:hypothetical protein
MKNSLPASACAGLVAAALTLTATVAAAQTAPAASPPFPTTATPTAPQTSTGSAWGTGPAPQASGGVTAVTTTQGPSPASATPPITLPPGSRLVPTGDGGFVVQGPAVTPTRTPAPAPAPSRVAVATSDDEGSESVGLRHRPKKVWYGWQTLVVDGAGLLVGALAASNDSGGMAGVASLNYAVGAPIVHAAHGEGIRALASIGLRTALPGAVGLLAYAVSDNSSDESAIYGGIVLGAIGAMALDAGVLAYEEHCGCDRDAKAAKKSVAKSFSITPSVAPRAGGATLGVVGSF